MRTFILALFGVLLIISCNKTEKSELNLLFNCENSNKEPKKEITDFRKNFTIELPKHWKTELFYSQTQSEIYSADTTKQLTDTYIIDVSHHLGEISFNKDFFKKNDSVLKQQSVFKIKSNTLTFNEKEAYFYITQETKQQFIVNRLNLLIKTSSNTYISAFCEVYGNQQIEQRFCDGISVLNTLKFLH